MNRHALTHPTGRWLVVTSFLSAASCSSSVAPTSSARTWSVVAAPTTVGFTSVRGSGPTDVWITGDTTIRRWDGQKWDSISSPVPGFLGTAPGLWANAPSDVWLGVGLKDAYHWTGAPPWITASLNDNRVARTFWGSGPTDVWTSDCAAGYLGHWDGAAWNHLNSLDAGNAIWGSGTSDVWMIEVRGGSPLACDSGATSIAHWSGIAGFGSKQTQFTFLHNLRALWGSGASDIWAVGEAGAIVHYDGTAWSQVTNSPTTLDLRGVWGTAANDVWAVGDSGVMLHFDGSGWSKGVHLTSRTLRAVWGDPSGDVWVVGDTGTMLRLTR